MKKKTYAQLEREVIELRGQLACTYKAGLRDLFKCSNQYFMASGILVTLSALGGRELATPFVVKDGLSCETIDALRGDILRSSEETP